MESSLNGYEQGLMEGVETPALSPLGRSSKFRGSQATPEEYWSP